MRPPHHAAYARFVRLRPKKGAQLSITPQEAPNDAIVPARSGITRAAIGLSLASVAAAFIRSLDHFTMLSFTKYLGEHLAISLFLLPFAMSLKQIREDWEAKRRRRG